MPNSKAVPAVTAKKSASSAHNLANAADLAHRCQHVKMNGQSCAAPARSDSDWCIFHAGDYEGRFPIAGVPEDAASIQVEIGRIIRQLESGKLEPPAAG